MDALPDYISRLTGWKAAALATVAGALSVLSMAPFFLWPVLFLTFPVLIWLFDGVALRERAAVNAGRRPWQTGIAKGAMIGWAFGFGFFLASIYWISYAFLVEPDRYAWSMPFAVAALPAALALFYAVAGALTVVLWQPGYTRLAGFAVAFFAAELARSYLFTGFPWNLFGYALTANAALMQAAAVAGVFGLTLAALYIFASPAALIATAEARRGRRLVSPLLLSLLAIGALFAAGTQRLASARDEMVEGVNLRLVQSNIPQSEKWKPENRSAIFQRHLDLSKNGTDGTDISAFTHVFWPESAVPFLFVYNGALNGNPVRQHLADLIPDNALLIVGAERADGKRDTNGQVTIDGVYNSLFALDGDARILETYDKTHLVPFGEYVPFRETLALLGLGAFNHRLEGFNAGNRRATVRLPQTPPFSPLICYEIIFPGRATLSKDRAHWLVNLTNDAWFGNSTGPYQHLQQAKVRAVEEGLPVVRVANTGISAIINPYGEIKAQLSLNETGVIDHGLPQAIQQTIFSKASRQILVVLILFPLLFYFAILSRLGRG